MFMNICEHFPYPYEYVYFIYSYFGRIFGRGYATYRHNIEPFPHEKKGHFIDT